MKRFNCFYLLFFCFWIGQDTIQAQVVFREYLSQDHSGILENSLNYPGKKLGYEWEFVGMEKGQYFAEGEAIQKIVYRLNFTVGGKPVGYFDLQMRDLIVSYYVEISAIKEKETRTIMALYKKSSRWLKLKGVLQEGCHREGQSWGRLDGVESYDQLLHFIIEQLDKNLDFTCYFD